ncbi:MAG: DedA family protein [Ardenticatenales bacterium]|jgi:membrane-associated protein|nr:DedA family protein [Ardenticatenales bacterium]
MIGQFIDVFLHLDQHLNTWAGALGPWLYVLLFAIVFCETGLVVTPFLPGDSLLFAVGALATTPGSPIHVVTVSLLLIVAAILGDATNYAIGRRVGPRVFSRESSWLLNKQHLIRTQHFYEHHGGKTIFLARFMPIVRTFAPFVAGIGRMEYRRFAGYNVAGGITWVVLFIGAGYLFADLPIVKDRFHYVILGIIGVSVLPIVFEFARAQIAARKQRRLPEDGA